MRIHLDALGGVAGDMFIAALLDAFPEHEAGVLASIRAAAPPGLACELIGHNDGVFQGRRFTVRLGRDQRDAPLDHSHPSATEDGRHHHHREEHPDPAGDHNAAEATPVHRSWRSIRAHLESCGLESSARFHSLAIFTHLADAEARVHGVSPDEVSFHEVGAWDSIADIVGAGHLIAATGAERWTVSALPLGSGRVRTAHGLMPVPTPATALLLEGFAVLDDGAPGERVTPTGAAILRHLCSRGAPRHTGAGGPATLSRSGVGFGTRRLEGVSNCLRALVFEEPSAAPAPSHRELLVVEFEVDDQSAEDLAMGLDRLRAHADVFDAIQAPVFGKKGRMMTHVRLLARPGSLDAVGAAVFAETTTIGLRHHIVGGAALPREAREVVVGDRTVRVKTVQRSGGRTAKAEADDVRAEAGHAARAALRRSAERAALDGEDDG